MELTFLFFLLFEKSKLEVESLIVLQGIWAVGHIEMNHSERDLKRIAQYLLTELELVEITRYLDVCN